MLVKASSLQQSITSGSCSAQINPWVSLTSPGLTSVERQSSSLLTPTDSQLVPVACWSHKCTKVTNYLEIDREWLDSKFWNHNLDWTLRFGVSYTDLQRSSILSNDIYLIVWLSGHLSGPLFEIRSKPDESHFVSFFCPNHCTYVLYLFSQGFP